VKRLTQILAACVVILGGVASLARGEDKKPDDKAGPKITYDEHVVPILREKCFGCHNPDKKSGGLILNNFTSLMAGGGSGAIIEPGNPDESTMYLVMTHQEQPFMPPMAEKLPQAQLDIIRKWIEGGALENAGSRALASKKPKVDISLKSAPTKKPDGLPPMPQNLLLEPIVRTARANAVTAIVTSPWAPLVAVAGQKQVILYNPDSLDYLGVLPFPEGLPTVLKFSRNGSLLLAAGGRGAKAGRVVVWNVVTGERVIEVGDEFDTVLAADISADQTRIALGGPSKMIRIYSTADGQLEHEIKKHTDWVTALEFSPDGVLLATGDRNGGLFVWEANTAREYLNLRAHSAAITDISWRIDSNVLASSSEDTTIRLWEMENGGNIKGWGAHGGGAAAVEFTHDGRIASCGRDRVTKIWDQNGAQQRAFDAFGDLALRVTFNHDGSRVIAGDWTGDIRVWSTADGKVLGNLTSNPPTLTERIDAANKDLAARQVAATQLAAAATASKAAADKATADLAGAQKIAADMGAAAKVAADNAAKVKVASDNAANQVPVANSTVAVKQAVLKAVTEVATQADEMSKKAPDNKGLADAAARTKEHVNQANADVVAAQKVLADTTAAAKVAADQLATAQAAVQKANADVAAATKQVETLTPVAKAAADKAAADKSAADQAAAAVAATQAAIAKWTAAINAAKQATEQARLDAQPK
jgi:hypothetical protein